MWQKLLVRTAGTIALVVSLAWIPAARGQQVAATGGAAEAVATVLAVRGNVTAFDRAGKNRQLPLKSELFRGDTIKSGDRGRIQISFLDETLISLGANTEMSIERFDYKPNQNDGELVTHVREGAFRVMGGAIAKIAPSKFKTETPTATIGIRGSFYAGNVAALQLTAIFLGGRGITVFNAAGFVEITRPSFGTTVPAANAPPEPPRRFSTAEIGQLLTGFAFSGLGGDTSPAGDSGGSEPAGTGTPGGGDSGTPSGDGGTETPTGTPDSGGGGTGPTGGTESGSGSTPNTQSYTELQNNNPNGAAPTPPNQPPGPTPLSLNGRFLNLFTPFTRYSAGAEAHRGTVTGSSLSGAVSGAQAQATDGSNFGFNLNLALANPNPGGVYDPTLAGGAVDATGHPVVLTGPLSGTFNAPFAYKYDNLGEFSAFRTQGTLALGTGAYTEVGFLGSPSLTLPAGAIAHYEGFGLAVQTPLVGSATAAFGDQSNFAAVNFYNHTVLGGFYQPLAARGSPGVASGTPFGEQTLFFFGKLNGLDLVDTHVLGVGNSGSAATFQGSLDYGQFFGSAHQGFGLAGSGTLYDLGSGLQTGNFDLAMAATKQQETIMIPTYPSTWTGFAVGAVPVATGTPQVYATSTAGDMTLNFDRRAGTVTGSMAVTNGSTHLNATVGTEGSAYVDDYRFLATLTDAGAGPGSPPAGVDPAQPGASLLVTDPSASNKNEWYSWGYWSLSHTGVSPGSSFHIPLLNSLWVAGETTDPLYVKGVIASGNTVGVYRGEARGLEALPGGILNTLLGSSTMNVFFGTRDVQGSLVFPTVSLQTAGTIATDGSGFAGSVTSLTRPAEQVQSPISSSSFQGAFLGPQVNAVAGSVGASLADGSVYKAVYAGNRQ